MLDAAGPDGAVEARRATLSLLKLFSMSDQTPIAFL
jgi:hypothetical protein